MDPKKKGIRKTEKQAAPILRKTYLNADHSVGFAGAKPLVDVARVKGVKPSTTQKWLESQLAYTLHKPAERRFKRNQVIVNGKDEQWQADLVDMQALKKDNDGYRFLLTVIDVLSKYAWVVPLKDKTGKSLVDAFDAVFKKEGRVPKRLQTDAGKEFLNKEFQRFLTSKNVHHFVTYNETKAKIVGDKVRISKKKGTFEKGYLPNWTEEVFSIVQQLRRIPPVYRLREYDGTMLEGTFYELQPVQQSESNMFRIEKILKVRGKGKGVEYIVRWSGWPSKYDQWLPASSLKHL